MLDQSHEIILGLCCLSLNRTFTHTLISTDCVQEHMLKNNLQIKVISLFSVKRNLKNSKPVQTNHKFKPEMRFLIKVHLLPKLLN